MSIGGELTPEVIDQALDGLWNLGRRPFQYTGLLSVLSGKSPLACGAALFAPDESLVNAIRAELIMTGTPVHPLQAAWLNAPVQGPAPPACAREPHPGSPWHWDGCGTWWH